ncbi:Arrowhead-like protein 2, partial [Sarcoptes scabiei]
SRSCYIRNGQIFCKDDYAQLIKCSKCDRTIASNDWVRRAGMLVYHLACFACDLCQRQLSTGEKFTIEKSSISLAKDRKISTISSEIVTNKNDEDHHSYRLICKLHFGIDQVTNSILNENSDLASSTKLDRIDDSNQSLDQSINFTQNNLTRSGSSLSNSKTKRVRTTFTEDQLSVLQANFQLDSNPDGQDLERIATLTGLSKRVTQVWFQNSRARQKKFMNKSSPPSSSSSSVASQQSINNHRNIAIIESLAHPKPMVPLVIDPISAEGDFGQSESGSGGESNKSNGEGVPSVWQSTKNSTTNSNSSLVSSEIQSESSHLLHHRQQHQHHHHHHHQHQHHRNVANHHFTHNL